MQPDAKVQSGIVLTNERSNGSLHRFYGKGSLDTASNCPLDWPKGYLRVCTVIESAG